MDINERFAALPRARKGSTIVIIAEEAVLAELLRDAGASNVLETRPLTTITGGATGGAPMVIHVDPPPPPSADVIVESVRRSRRRLGGASRGW